jgi:hypothetical protein
MSQSPKTGTQYPVSSTQHLSSSIQDSASSTQYRVSSTQQPATDTLAVNAAESPEQSPSSSLLMSWGYDISVTIQTTYLQIYFS